MLTYLNGLRTAWSVLANKKDETSEQSSIMISSRQTQAGTDGVRDIRFRSCWTRMERKKRGLSARVVIIRRRKRTRAVSTCSRFFFSSPRTLSVPACCTCSHSMLSALMLLLLLSFTGSLRISGARKTPNSHKATKAETYWWEVYT